MLKAAIIEGNRVLKIRFSINLKMEKVSFSLPCYLFNISLEVFLHFIAIVTIVL